ncbi:long-chain-acyl-CoA synthetase [Oharaeibacter diazotrophicus]|uniref:Fatty-acyl-CoA synthase n=1 Tax=Oharaeibacter diazotrophicus TaxID=1920512 RepID=A0A4R6REE6_9HYPH|nr:long-chain-acyl-CoA synthetase [Oharaeibacter diazotrophicus]TDP84046.1 fatty-acyl-CoA synthase [Oharaeibacter diazotrophicus]BBE73085.1 long-chain-fatty-acid-CoA ligase [Pleomorphomonas sp. SM30]GLS74874.1 long-chain-acyl-CoA synthetase [Oharaeibacter diazotrophicus]
MGFVERLRSEYAYLSGAIRALRRTTAIARNPDRVYPDVVADLAARFGERPALISDCETFTYSDYHRRGNRYARWALANGIGRGDTVALLMPNRPEYLAVWLGVARAGGVTALLNTNLAGASLAHCVNIVAPKIVIVAAELADVFETARPHLTGAPAIWGYGAGAPGARLDLALADLDDADVPAAERPKLTTSDRCLWIYTSGTTGMPKAANINHYRVQAIMNGFSAAMNATKDDRMYVALPLYHTSGGVLATGTVLTVGGAVVIREKFSAREFWDDLVRYDCTLFQYIGELCRYLLNTPPHPKERAHRVRLASGNGLRPDIWTAFQERFAIPQILEWYAATEGNAVLFNFDGKPGSIGRVPKWAERKFLLKVVRFDVAREEVVRGPDGRCVACGPDEVGELISEIVDDPKKPSQRFNGYADAESTRRKILENAFSEGDRWFRTGDLVRRDRLGYYYFVDRIGDTFRWKGENVATSEVAEAIGVFPGVHTANVYGVAVPDRDGRAGMAALEADDGLDLAALSRHLDERLPAYAKPVFLRRQGEIETTTTFKLKKVDLKTEGFDPNRIADELFYLDPASGTYVRLDPATYDRIVAGTVRL